MSQRKSFIPSGLAHILKRRRNGRPESAERKRRLFFEALQERVVLAVVNWDGGAGTFNWNDANNWENDILPGMTDDAVIGDLTGTPTITVTATTDRKIVTATEKIAVAHGRSVGT